MTGRQLSTTQVTNENISIWEFTAFCECLFAAIFCLAYLPLPMATKLNENNLSFHGRFPDEPGLADLPWFSFSPCSVL